MSKSPIHPPGDAIQKAIRELSYLVENKPDKTRNQLLQEVALKFDLSPLECDFLQRHLAEGLTNQRQ